jgi:hypothetical protein
MLALSGWCYISSHRRTNAGKSAASRVMKRTCDELLRTGVCDCSRSQGTPQQFRYSFEVGQCWWDEALRVSLSKVKRTQLDCSSLIFIIAHLCLKRDHSVPCAQAGDRGAVVGLFLKIATTVRICITVPDSLGALAARSSPVRFEADT